MSKWIEAKLADICLQEKGAIISGPFGSNISSKYFVSKGVPVIRGNNLSLDLDKFYDDGFVFVTEQKAEELNCYAIEGDLLFTAAGTIGQVGILQAPLKYKQYVISNKQMRARIDTSKVGLLYAYYWYSSPWMQNYFIRNNKGSTVPLITLSELKEAPIRYPESIQEQQAIVEAIERISKKIDLNREICGELESMAKTLYDYWFVQFDFPDANGKPYRASGGEMVWIEQLKREIPKGWSVNKIGELLASIPNTVRIQTGEYNTAGKIPVIDQSTDFIAGYTDDDNSVLYSEHGHIVFGDHTRIVKYIRFPFARGADGTQIISSNDDRIPNELFYQAIKNIDLSNYGYARHFKFLKDTPVIVPTTKVAHEYINIVKSMYDKTVQLLFENIELSKLRDWLLPMLMNGQATVAPAESPTKLQVLQPEKPTRDPRFDRWLQTQGVAARGTVDEQTLHDIFDAMDDDDKQ